MSTLDENARHLIERMREIERVQDMMDDDWPWHPHIEVRRKYISEESLQTILDILSDKETS